MPRGLAGKQSRLRAHLQPLSERCAAGAAAVRPGHHVLVDNEQPLAGHSQRESEPEANVSAGGATSAAAAFAFR